MSLSGSNPRKGIYKCVICDHLVRLDDYRRTLPLCPKCDGISFIGKNPESHV